MTQLDEAQRTTTTADRRAFLRGWLTWSGLVLASVLTGQVIASRNDDDLKVREAWLSDTVFVLVASTLFGAVALLFAWRGLAGDARRQERTVIGLAVMGAVLAVVGWFTAAGPIAALASVFLARSTGASQRSAGARASVVVSFVVAVGLVVFIWSTLIAEDLLF